MISAGGWNTWYVFPSTRAEEKDLGSPEAGEMNRYDSMARSEDRDISDSRIGTYFHRPRVYILDFPQHSKGLHALP
jgi:hypothetical protein